MIPLYTKAKVLLDKFICLSLISLVSPCGCKKYEAKTQGQRKKRDSEEVCDRIQIVCGSIVQSIYESISPAKQNYTYITKEFKRETKTIYLQSFEIFMIYDVKLTQTENSFFSGY